MANIQTFDGIRNDSNNRNRGLLGAGGVNMDTNGFLGGFFASKETKDPREESFWDMIRLILCPTLTWCSFVSIISIVLTGIFILQISLDGLVLGNAKQFLEIQQTGIFTSHLDLQYDKLRGSFCYFENFFRSTLFALNEIENLFF